jgi:homoserine kinase
VIVRVPASSANVGPGFDTMALALGLHAEIGTVDEESVGVPDGARPIDRHHPAAIAFEALGGTGALWERSAIPAGRGLGFSGAVRVGGALLGRAQATGSIVIDDAVRHAVLPHVTELEGHADNVAASLFGGAVVTAGGRVVRVPLAIDPAVVVWIPSFVTKTDESRRTLAASVSFDDAVFNVGRVAILVAALAAGDIDALATATEDRLHQPARLSRTEPCRAAMAAALDAGAWCSWLSGSGPTVAALCHRGDAEAVVSGLPEGAHCKVLRLDHEGATIEPAYT